MKPVQAITAASVLNKGLSFRRRERRDGDDLWRMFRQPMCRRGSILEPFQSPAETQKWLDGLPGHFDTVATIADRAVALGGLYVGTGNQDHVGTLSLFVHDDFHRRRIGTMILALLLEVADEIIGLARVQLLVFCDNEPALALYRKFAFAIDGRYECFARRGDELLAVYSMARLKATRAQITGETPSQPIGPRMASANSIIS